MCSRKYNTILLTLGKWELGGSLSPLDSTGHAPMTSHAGHGFVPSSTRLRTPLEAFQKWSIVPDLLCWLAEVVLILSFFFDFVDG